MREKISTSRAIDHTDQIRKIAMLLTLIAVATAGFDELLVIEVHGMTMRYSLFFTAAACLCLLIVWIKEKKMHLPFGWIELSALLLLNFILCFSGSSGSMIMKLGYEAWFILDVALVVLCVGLFSSEKQKKFFLKFVVGTYVFMAVICLLQVISGLLGYSFYQNQWFGHLPRGDGFLSEPSYFACFTLPCWVFLAYENERKSIKLFSGKCNVAFWAILTAAILVSTSRMGLLMIIIWMVFRFGMALIPYKREKSVYLKRIIWMSVTILSFFIILQIAFGSANHSNEETNNFEQGNIQSSVNNQTFIDRMNDFSGSDAPRLEGMKATIQTFQEKHIWIGSSLGGVFPAVMENTTTARQVVNLLAELLVAFGLPGFLVLGCYMVRLICAVCKEGKHLPVTIALCWGLLWQLGILQFNNNGLRIYLWVNIAVISVYLPKTVFNLESRRSV